MRMLLSRTAGNLFWLGRYVERAGSTARLIEMGHRMAMLPGAYSTEEWNSVAAASGCLHLFDDEAKINDAAIIRTLILDRENPSSIRSCLEAARTNGRAVRTSLTMEMWEALNDGWRKLELMDAAQVQRELPGVLDWVKQRSSMLRGTVDSGMLRNDSYDFLRLGAHIERADMMLRLLDVKYFVLLPETDVIGGGRDHHQWTSVLHATSAIRAFHHIYRGDYSPGKIAEFLLLSPAFPRSVLYSYDLILTHLDRLANSYGDRHDCHETAARTTEELRRLGINEIFRTGLHEFVQDMIRTTRKLTAEIFRAYHL